MCSAFKSDLRHCQGMHHGFHSSLLSLLELCISTLGHMSLQYPVARVVKTMDVRLSHVTCLDCYRLARIRP